MSSRVATTAHLKKDYRILRSRCSELCIISSDEVPRKVRDQKPVAATGLVIGRTSHSLHDGNGPVSAAILILIPRNQAVITIVISFRL